jgi:hypothetical protein
VRQSKEARTLFQLISLIVPIFGDIGIVVLQLCDEVVAESRGSSRSVDVSILFLGDELAMI